MSQDRLQGETLLLKQPAISAGAVAFVYGGDLWIAGQDGQNPRRLTAQKGQKTSPAFSPDGQWIAFSANYDGNNNVYVISREGGMPRRLTYHPLGDGVRGWTPDGKNILFSSARDSVSMRSRRLFTIPFEGGLPTPLPMRMAERGAYSPDGKYLAFTPYFEAFWTWKRYRGGMTLPIKVLDLATLETTQVPHVNASDTFPAWLGDTLYFLSDRSGMMNVFSWKVGSDAVEQITHHDDFDVRSLSAGDGKLAYEQGGRIHIYDPAAGESKALRITITADLPGTRPHFTKAINYIQSYDISPSGQRAVFEARGEILTVPAKKGDIRNLTQTPGVFDRFPAWSPDGQSIAYFSDASGEYELVISDQKGVQKSSIPLGLTSFFYTPVWSPDSKKIAFTTKALQLYVIELESKRLTCVDTDTYDHPERSLNPTWAPDSRWLAYNKRLDNHLRAIFLYDVEAGKSHQVTDGMSDAKDACFSRDGKLLFFTASSNYGLNTGWLDMSSLERPVLRSLYLAVLSREDASPLAPESDEEAVKKEEEKPEEKDKKPAPVIVKIDLEGLGQRIQALPLPARDYADLQASNGKLFFLQGLTVEPIEGGNPSYNLRVFDLKERKDEVFVDNVKGYKISADGKKLIYQSASEPKIAIVGTEKKPEAQDGVLNLGGMEVWVDPRQEWRQIFREAFRIHRDFFYDPEFHGLDLEAAYQKYLPFLDHVAHRDDLNYLLGEFSGELVVGHAYVYAGDIPTEEQVKVGLLGVDYEVDADGYYRFKKIYPGLNWRPGVRSPLTEPGLNVKEGEYLLAVNGRPLRLPTNVYSLFEKTADKVTDLLVGPTPDPAQARVISVKPVANESALRLWAWVEENRKKVDELSQGRVAYLYMPDTHMGGYEAFNRYYFAQLDKQAVIVDERFNNGGSVADYIVDLLNRPLLSYWATREGKVFSSPNASIFGPKAMIVNELSGSGGDAMPLFFHRRGLGKLVGKRTWGGLVGVFDYPVLIDGGFFSSPRLGIFSPKGEWEVENEGVPVDVEVEMTPRLVAEGRDPQLEKAVEVVLAELKANPPVRPPRPPSPRRARPSA